MKPLAVALDDLALAVFPQLEVSLAERGARVLRSFAAVPGPHLLSRLPGCRGTVVVGGKSWADLVGRLEQATAVTRVPVIGVVPSSATRAQLEVRWPGVVDLVPPGETRPAERIVLMSQVPIVSAPGKAAAPALPCAPIGKPARIRTTSRVVGVASSTGGVWVLAQLLRALASRCTDTFLIAQHLDAEFIPFFAQWLREASSWPVCLVSESAGLQASTVFLAAGKRDLVLDGAMLRALPARGHFVPSGDRLLTSLARSLGERTIGLVLSGMGSDGALGLAEIARAGGRALCQLPETAIVSSMPQSALSAAPGAVAVDAAQLPSALLEAW